LQFALREGDCKKRKHESEQQCSAMNPAGFDAETTCQTFILDALFARIHIARPARSHRDSGFFARLK
jgi:hypothetical protein